VAEATPSASRSSGPGSTCSLSKATRATTTRSSSRRHSAPANFPPPRGGRGGFRSDAKGGQLVTLFAERWGPDTGSRAPSQTGGGDCHDRLRRKQRRGRRQSRARRRITPVGSKQSPRRRRRWCRICDCFRTAGATPTRCSAWLLRRHCTRPRRADENTDAIVRVVRTRRSQGGRPASRGPLRRTAPVRQMRSRRSRRSSQSDCRRLVSGTGWKT
jgi:hypothetical protein